MGFQSEWVHMWKQRLNIALSSPALGLVVVKLLFFCFCQSSREPSRLPLVSRSFQHLRDFLTHWLKFIIWRPWPRSIDPCGEGLESLLGQTVPSSLQGILQRRVWCLSNWPLILFYEASFIIVWWQRWMTDESTKLKKTGASVHRKVALVCLGCCPRSSACVLWKSSKVFSGNEIVMVCLEGTAFLIRRFQRKVLSANWIKKKTNKKTTKCSSVIKMSFVQFFRRDAFIMHTCLKAPFIIHLNNEASVPCLFIGSLRSQAWVVMKNTVLLISELHI